ncbi:HPr family phosphocarrier protein [Lihuaxuella thermophila]|uniref:Phosphocarrier protein n=1 Tax=Lihuaxuella thermophila TaxID=1173111 RepID=A0A1H8C6E6_9BACL|nr:HPr family phosphocarrier protein [Lihuaxuella thermophila]SEM90645.1 phosphocarrier protein [Lihuaxuella thermophila]
MMELTSPCKIPQKIDLTKVLRFVETADQFNSYIVIETNDTTINAKSVLGMCMLASGFINGPALLRTYGADADLALEQLKKLFAEGFGVDSEADQGH